MFWLLEPRWYGVCAIVGLMTAGVGYWKGYEAADKSAEISALEQTVKTANASIDALTESARRANASAASYAAREQSDNAEAATDEGQINVITTEQEERPATDICRLSPHDYDLLRSLALRASGAGNPSPPASLDIRPAGPRSAPPRP